MPELTELSSSGRSRWTDTPSAERHKEHLKSNHTESGSRLVRLESKLRAIHPVYHVVVCRWPDITNVPFIDATRIIGLTQK